MKKSILLLISAMGLFSMTSIKSHAQVAMSSQTESLAFENAVLAEPSGIVTDARNLKAETNFLKVYRHATGIEWSTLKDNSWMCRFYIDNISHRAFYSGKGKWLGTVSSYDGSKLDKNVSDRVKSNYYDFNIVFVNQVDMPGNKIFYIVEIQNEKSIRKIRIDNDEMDVVQEFEKH
jgi:hypothetical protein